MFKKSSTILGICVLITFLISHLVPINASYTIPPTIASLIRANIPSFGNYTPHASIEVTNDFQLAVVATNGIGTIDDPYIISGWNITGSDTDGISIKETSRYFRIENCWIAKSAYQGINIDNISQGTATITNNTCTSNGRAGIYLSQSVNSTVKNNTCVSNGESGIYLSSGFATLVNNSCTSNNEDGIYILGSSTLGNNTCVSNGKSGINLQGIEGSTATAANNSCTNNNEHGIALQWSDYSELENNFLANNSKSGIYIRDSPSSTIINNTCARNGEAGISLYLTSSVTIFKNTCTRNSGPGIYPLYSPSSIIANNTCSGNLRAGIYHHRSDYSIIVNNTFYNDGYALSPSKQEIFSCTVDNNTINSLPLGYFENLTNNIITQTYGQLILVNCNNMVVQNQNYSNTSIGITLSYCEDIQLVNNTCNNNSEFGFYLKDSDFSTIVNNTCSDNDASGIYLLSSSFLNITNNTCNGNRIYGVCLLYSNSSTLTENICNNNHPDGISFRDSDFSVINHNTCNNNTEAGISLSSSDHNSIVWNLLVGNGDYGVTVSTYSNINSIHHNFFIGNGQKTSQAYDDGSNNQWYDESLMEGNYWSDYSGNGIYQIAGTAEARDLYPSLSHTAKQEDFSSAFIRVGLFLVVLGFLGVSVFLARRPKSA